MAIGTSSGAYFEDSFDHAASVEVDKKKLSDAREIGFNQASSDFQSRFYATDQSTMPPGASTELAGALKSFGGTGTPENDYNTKLTPEQETSFQTWKQKNAPNDSGADYDLRGAFQAGLSRLSPDEHLPDTYKKPNHPTFSDQSMYAKYAPDKAGTWDGDRYIPAAQRSSIADDLFGKGENDIRPALMKAGEGIKNAFALPGDVLSGKVQAGSVQEIERAADLASMLITGPAPVAAKMADGTLGSFMGVRSKTLDKSAVYKAQNMEMNGATVDEIHEATGTFRGADNRWRQEIDDSKMKLRPEAFEHTITPDVKGSDGMGRSTFGFGDVGGNDAIHTVTPKSKVAVSKPIKDWKDLEDLFNQPLPVKTSLEQTIDHPELFKAYPELRGVTVQELPDFMNPKGTLMGAASGRDIYLAKDLHPDFAKSVISHEVQHIIQSIEGFGKGGSSDMFRPAGLDEAETFFNKVKEDTLKETLGKGYTPEHIEALINHADDHLANGTPLNEFMKENPVGKKIVNIVKAQRLLDDAAEKHFEQYQRLMGEVESRNVQARLNYDKFTRANIPPGRTEDRFRELQINTDSRGQARSEEPTQFRRAANDNKRGSMEHFVDEAGQIRGSRIDKVLEDVDKSWKKLAETSKRNRELIEESFKMRDKFVDRDWSDFEYARYNKINKELYGEHWTPVTREELNKPL